MEDILEVYQRPYDPLRPVICYDERPCVLIGETICPLPIDKGKVKKEDYHFERNGTANLLVAYEPKTGWRHVRVTKHRAFGDYASFQKELAEVYYPHAIEIVLVQDNLSTHSPSAFYASFSAEEAKQLTEKFEMHNTPTNGSWLNMVEIELSAISRACLKRRIPDIETLETEVMACVKRRNSKRIKVDWQFTVNSARDKFHRFYPHNS